jgi:hypothetical protein
MRLSEITADVVRLLVITNIMRKYIGNTGFHA